MSSRHPSEAELALFAGGDCSPWQRFQLNSHVARCGDCRDTVASFEEIRSVVRDVELPASLSSETAWQSMSVEMRANIRLGLAAGECIASAPADIARATWLPRFAVGMAGVIFLLGAGIFLRGLLPPKTVPDAVRSSVLESSGNGVEVRTATGSMKLMNYSDVAGDQTVTSQGAIRSTNVDGSTGTVTVTSVYVD
jgi:anti-sigma factor RsiW